MNVMTFNLRADNLLDIHDRWTHRCHVVYEVIKKYNCDIIGTQEVTMQMAKDLKEHITDYYHLGISRTNYFFMERNTILLKKKYNVLKHRTFWLSQQPEKKGSNMWHSLFPRICTMVISNIEGRKVLIYNTHLDCLSPWARQEGLRIILNDMYNHQIKERRPCILTGDFNARADGKLMKAFKQAAYRLNGLRAVQDIKPELYKKTTMGGFKGKEYGRHIDYIFATQEFDVKNVEIIRYDCHGQYPSDHYPIMAELAFR